MLSIDDGAKGITIGRLISSIFFLILTAIGFQMSKSTVPSGSSHGIETSNFKHFGSLPRGSINTFLFLCLIGSVSFIVIDSMILHEIMEREKEENP